MKTEIANTSKFLIARTGVILLVAIHVVGRTAFSDHTRRGWYEGPMSGKLIIHFVLVCTILVIVFFALIRRTIGSIELAESNIIFEKIKKQFKFQDKKANTNNRLSSEELVHSEISSIQLLLDSGKEKPIYTREYFKGAENNWLIIKEKSGKIHKIEILIKSLEMEKAIINYLERLKEKNIEISYGTKRKTFLHAIRCAF